jgi:RNA polymerase sigma-70 factor, ECF subfamily
MSDAELVRQVLAGNTAAYAELMRRHAGRALAVCRARVWRPDDAEELAQEAVFRGLRDLPTLRNPEAFGGWLCRIARNVCLNWRRDRHRGPRPLCNEDVEDPGEGPDRVDRDDELRHLMQEVRRLPEELREVLMLYYSQNFTYAELAELLNVLPSRVNYCLWQAREMLRERLGRDLTL